MSAASSSQTVFSITYDFHLGAGNNGNVWAITNNRDTTRSQSFNYDSLNRLISAQNAGTDCTKNTLNGKTEYWANTYAYDAWGNLTDKNKTGCGAEDIHFNTDAHNWLHVKAGADYAYDAAGNMTYNAHEAQTYTYDPENRITGAAGFTYTYDADGNRVKKSNGATGTLYWYMAPGIVAESDLSGNLTAEYAFFAGERIARRDFTNPPTVSYYFSDHLKTASVITDSSGNIKSDSDYYPWGGELEFIANDSNHYKFTGKERDSETNLDYFGARYYANALGRFITPDWAAKATAVPYADFADPQSLNLYTYVRDIPTSKADVDGHCFWDLCIVEAGVALVTVTEALVMVGTGVGLGAAMDHQGALGSRGQIDPNDNISMAMSEGMVTQPAEGVNTQTPASTPTTGVNTQNPTTPSNAGTVDNVSQAKGTVPLSDRDPKRFYTPTEKDTLKDRAKGRCDTCGRSTTRPKPYRAGSKHSSREGQAGHKKAWSKGGRTNLKNGKWQCKGCNQKEGADSK